MKITKANMIRIKYLFAIVLFLVILSSIMKPRVIEGASMISKFGPKLNEQHVPDKCKRYMSKKDWEQYKIDNKLPDETKDDGTRNPDINCMRLRTSWGEGAGIRWKPTAPLKLQGDRCDKDSECESKECTCCTWFRYTCN